MTISVFKDILFIVKCSFFIIFVHNIADEFGQKLKIKFFVRNLSFYDDITVEFLDA